MPRDVLHSALERSPIALLLAGAVLVLLLSTGAARAGDTRIYKSVDAQGNVVYSDRASSTDAQKSTVHFHDPSANDLAQLEEQRKAAQAAENTRAEAREAMEAACSS